MKTAIVFGHSSGLGLEVTKSLLGKGFRVIGFARSKAPIKSENLINVSVNLLDRGDTEKAIEEISSKYSSFEAFIFCAGVLTAHPIDRLDYPEMERIYKINTFAPMIIESGLVDLFKKNGADIVNVTSSSIFDYYPQFTEYSTSKIALQKFTADLERELKAKACRVIEFCPSGFASNIYKTMTGDKINRDESAQIKTEDLASLLVHLLELPKKIEVSNIFVNRK